MDGGYGNPALGIEQHLEIAKAATSILNMSLGQGSPFHDFLFSVMMPEGNPVRNPQITEFLKSREVTMEQANLISAELRKNPRSYLGRYVNLGDLLKGSPTLTQKALLKANLDVGTLTNLANVTGGQSLGYVSLDTQMARGTVRPSSFTLYQCLHKTRAFQVVDYWAYNSDIGGSNLPGTAFKTFAGVGSGTLQTVAGIYSLQDVFLKLVVNGRAMTVALAAQNNFVDVATQENINAALTCLESLNWAAYWGDPTTYPSQYVGIASGIPTANSFNYQDWSNSQSSAQGWSAAQTLFNMIYQVAGLITQYNQFGRITHAFMSPITAGSLNGLVTTILNNIVTFPGRGAGGPEGIVANGDLQGMRTRFGEIMFPIDLFINARDKPAQAIIKGDGTNFATSVSPTPPASLAVTVSGTNPKSKWTAAYVASSGIYTYAAAATDQFMNESTLAFASPVSGIAVGGAYQVAVTGGAATDFAAFRIYRSGLGFVTSNFSGITGFAQNNAAYRYIGTILASGSGGGVTFVDLNTHIPGSEWVFLLDLDMQDMALDYRYLLPLTKIELFAQNLYMPWAVTAIGGVRLKVPKFHGLITNYVPDNPDFNPLAANATAS